MFTPLALLLRWSLVPLARVIQLGVGVASLFGRLALSLALLTFGTAFCVNVSLPSVLNIVFRRVLFNLVVGVLQLMV